MQLAYNRNMATAIAGMPADAGFTNRYESFVARERIDFGLGVGGEVGDMDTVQLPTKDKVAMVFDADLVTSNSIVLSITIDGVTTTLDAVVFATSHANTMNLLKAALEGVTGVDVVTAVTRTLTVWAHGKTISAMTEAITGGASQATGTATISHDGTFRGISRHIHNEKGYYSAVDSVTVATKGPHWVKVNKAVTADSAAYVDLSTGDGEFTDTSSNNLATGGVFKSSTTGAGLAILDLNLP